MNFWQYILQPTTASLGPVAIAMIFASVLGIVLGIALMVLPKELVHLAALLGYLIGLVASLGDDIRTLLPWLKLSGK